MTFGSLFAGIGGLDLGLERAGMSCVWQVEQDDYCRRVLAKHWPDVPKWPDVRTFTGDDFERPDLICGGFPCQPVSTAGKRLGTKDPRWLWPEFARVLRVVRPRYALLENTPGLFSRGFSDVLGDLAALGFAAEWQVVPAAAFGAPHIRDRVFVLAHAPGDRERPVSSRQARGEAADPQPLRTIRPDVVGQRRAKVGQRNGRPPGRADAAERDRPPADADGPRLPAPEQAGRREPDEAAAAFRGAIAECDWWSAEPAVVRMVHGLPGRVDRVRALGNAVVPQVAEWIGRRIVAFDAGRINA